MDPLKVEGWRSIGGDSSTQATAWRRPLGITEYGFYWDTVLDGTATMIDHLEIEAEASFEHDLFSRTNIETAWLRLKQRFPLLGVSVEEVPCSDRVEFSLTEEQLRSIRPGEINRRFGLRSAEDVVHFSDELRSCESVLDPTCLAKVWVGQQLDLPRRYHVWIIISHCITDGMSDATVVREFCQELGSLSYGRIVQGPPLEIRLKRLIPAEAFAPSAMLSLPRRRWRLAVAKVIQLRRQAKIAVGVST